MSIVFISILLNCKAQTETPLPKLSFFTKNIDTFYNKKLAADTTDLVLIKTKTFQDYLPNISINPLVPIITKRSILTALNVSVDLDKPLRTRKEKYILKNQILKIKRLSSLQHFEALNAFAGEYEAVKNKIAAYHYSDENVILKEKEFVLFTEQYRRNEVLPTIYFNKQEEIQALRIGRKMEVDAINLAITNLYIKSKTPINQPQN